MPKTPYLLDDADQTTAAVQDNPTTEQQNAAAAALAPDFEAITAALQSATTVLAKRAVDSVVGRSGGACDSNCLTAKVSLLVWEISCTLRFVIVKLGLGEYSSPLFSGSAASTSKGDSLLIPWDAQIVSWST